MTRLDLTGFRFDKWLVLSYAGDRCWKCRCDCGVEKIVNGGNLRGGLSTKCRKCGPGLVANKLAVGEASFNDLYSRYKKSAIVREITWNLSKDQVRALFIAPCTYCGQPPSNIWGIKLVGVNGTFTASGIDRLNNDKGYQLSNCVSCCKTCNYMKRSLSKNEFIAHVHRILDHIENL